MTYDQVLVKWDCYNIWNNHVTSCIIEEFVISKLFPIKTKGFIMNKGHVIVVNANIYICLQAVRIYEHYVLLQETFIYL